MKINVKSKGTQPTCQMPFVLSCEHCILTTICSTYLLSVVLFFKIISLLPLDVVPFVLSLCIQKKFLHLFLTFKSEIKIIRSERVAGCA